MNVFRLLGDSLHYAALLTLPAKIVVTGSSNGISVKAQILYLLVFITRYLDLFTNYVSFYNSFSKLFFIGIATITTVLISLVFPSSDTRKLDTLWVSPLILGPAMAALIWNHEMTIMELLWTFSIFLEAIVMLPQLHLSTKTKPNRVILIYMALMGSYRLFYCFNWIFRYH